jgi:hypothetical protein
MRLRRPAGVIADSFDATKIHTHTFGLHELPTALRYAREHIDDAIKVVVITRNAEFGRAAVPAGHASDADREAS